MADSSHDASGAPDSVETEGSTVEEAVKRALLQLNATLDEVDIDILSSGGGFLRRGGGTAKVRATRRDRPYSVEAEAEAETDVETETETKSTEGAAAEAMTAAETVEREPPAAEPDAPSAAPPCARPSPDRRTSTLLESGDELREEAEDILPALLDRMGCVADIERVSEEPLAYNIVGDDDLSDLIGPRGETLRSLGYLVNLMLARRLGQPCRVAVDVLSHREHRAEQLDDLAHTLADEVRDTKEPVTLESMPAIERRLIHVALAEDPDVRTYSIGEGDDRRVVISPKA